MELQANREVILPLLTRTAAVVERRQTLPILGNLLLQASGRALEVWGTDLEVEVRGQCEAQVSAEGETTVPARKLLDIVRNLPEGSDIRLKVKDERCVVTSGRGRYVLGTLPAGDFPSLQRDASEELSFEVEEGQFKRMLDKTSFAMAQQDVRYYLNGLLLEVGPGGLRAVATDGHRLARLDQKGPKTIEGLMAAILPFKTAVELRRQLSAVSTPMTISLGERTVRFVTEGCVTTSKLVDGRYPDYERVIPSSLGKRAVADKEALRKALGRTAILSNEKFRGVRLAFEPDVLRLQAHNPEQEEAVEEIELELDGEGATVGFNVLYLSDVLGAVEEEKVEIRFEDGNSSSIWRGLGAVDETYVVMPMRL